jgi:hypothetical protein
MGQMNKIENIPEAEKPFKKGYVSAVTESYTELIRQNPCDVTAIDAPGDLYERKGKIEEPEPANRPAPKALTRLYVLEIRLLQANGSGGSVAEGAARFCGAAI